MHRRPSGVTLSAAVLGIIDLFLLFGGLFYVVVAVLFAGNPIFPPSAPGQPAPPAHLIAIMMGFFAAMTLICAAWGISTFVGLLRMRRWASISIMIIGGCMAALSLLELFGCILVQFTMNKMVLPPNAGSGKLVPPNPVALQGAFFFIEALCLGVAAIGVWWIVYFARKKTREAFAQAQPGETLSSTAQLNPATPITDFSVALPLQAAPPSLEPAAVEMPTPAAVRERPISMTIVAVLLFFSSISLAFCCLLPYPQFLFGVQVSGTPEYLLLLSMAVLYALAGFGLLRRMHFGWLLAVGMQILGLLNLLTFLSPHVRQRYMDLLQTISKASAPAMPDAAQVSAQMLQQKLMSQMMMPLFAVCGLFILFILVLLWRARWAYKDSE